MRRQIIGVFVSVFVAISALAGCSGSHSSLPSLPSGESKISDSKARAASSSAASADVVAIDAGGGAAGGFAADEFYATQGSWKYSVTNPIDTTLIANPAPQSVYRSQRTGAALSYSIPGLTAGAPYTVTLSFAELNLTGPGQRLFNVSANGSQFLSNFDIFAAAGAADKAVEESFTVPASSTGTIALTMNGLIAMNGKKSNATVNAIEISPAGASPSPLVDWPSYGYDVARSGYNPYTTNITPASILQLHIAWQDALNGHSSTQPIVVANIAGHAALAIVGKYNVAQAYDALTGTLVWKTTLPLQDVNSCSGASSGISGTAAYDKALGAIFMAAGNGNPPPNHVILYRLSVATGVVTGQVDVTPTLLTGESNHSHSGIAFANGKIYLGTSSDCEGGGTYPMWRGRVVSVDPVSMALSNTFFTTWAQGGNYGGGGVWGWGGVSSDPAGYIYAATGNTETLGIVGTSPIPPPFVAAPDQNYGYGEHLVKLNSSLGLRSANYPGFQLSGHGDLDYAGTPVVFQPPGCGVLVATQGKGGTLVVNRSSDSSLVTSFALSVPSSRAIYIGNPGFSPATGYLYAAITSAGNGSSLLPPGLAAITGCGSSIAWHAQFGPDSGLLSGENPRSAPTVTAGGVVFMATPCVPDGGGGCAASGSPVGGALWAVEASTGTVLGGGKPILITASTMRMAPSADGDWLFAIDDSGNLYGLTIDAAVHAVSPKPGLRVAPTYVYKGD
jgi:hypothetical protein